MLAVLFGLLICSGQGDETSRTDIWPQWRGPTGDSVAPSRDLPTRWSKTENIAWQSPLPGWGNSTPAIWRDAVFVTTQENDRLLLLRLDRKSGKTIWQRDVGRGTPRRQGPIGNGRFHDEHNMASPSPVTDGQHVWVHFGNGDLACYTFSGEHVWKQNLMKSYGAYSIWWGHANSPCLAGDMIISVCMQDPKGDGPSYVVAHDKRTGKEKWLVKRATGASEEPADSYTTPLLFRNGDRTELIVFGGNVLDAYDPQNGKRLWHCGIFAGNRVISGPTLAGDTIYAVQGMKGPLFAVRGGGTGDVTASHVRWKYAGQTPDAASPVVANGLVFLATNPGMAVCIDAANGKELWKQRLANGFLATPLVVCDKVYFFGKEGKATIVEAARSFKVIAQCDLEEEIVASPAVAGNDLFLRTKENLYRIGKTTVKDAER
ncbi:MAG: PQQ-binding-like beta-propeller repeat protein [Planctomycetes bacterium]|nr:PQQ-binding-like beta-propeller repeat protein [Planctomycetota bacterium]